MSRNQTTDADKYVQPPRCVCASLRKASRAVSQLYDNALRPSGLRATQFHILSEIRASGEASVTALTRRLVIDQTTLTRGLALLERDALIRTVPKADGRIKSVQLTKKGDEMFMQAVPMWAAVQRRMIQSIGPEVWEKLALELEQIASEPDVSS